MISQFDVCRRRRPPNARNIFSGPFGNSRIYRMFQEQW